MSSWNIEPAKSERGRARSHSGSGAERASERGRRGGRGVGDERRRKSGLLLLATKAEGDSAASLERARVCAGVQVCVFVCV